MSRLHAACRFIERYNNKLRQAAKKDETRRMKAFVNNAYACDPRVLRRKAEEKAERYGRTHVIAAGSGSPWRLRGPACGCIYPSALRPGWSVVMSSSGIATQAESQHYGIGLAAGLQAEAVAHLQGPGGSLLCRASPSQAF